MFYDRTVKEPLVGAPLVAVLVNARVDVSDVGVVPQCIVISKLNVSPICDGLNDWLSVRLLVFLLGASAIIPEIKVKLDPPLLLTPVMVTLR